MIKDFKEYVMLNEDNTTDKLEAENFSIKNADNKNNKGIKELKNFLNEKGYASDENSNFAKKLREYLNKNPNDEKIKNIMANAGISDSSSGTENSNSSDGTANPKNADEDASTKKTNKQNNSSSEKNGISFTEPYKDYVALFNNNFIVSAQELERKITNVLQKSETNFDNGLDSKNIIELADTNESKLIEGKEYANLAILILFNKFISKGTFVENGSVEPVLKNKFLNAKLKNYFGEDTYNGLSAIVKKLVNSLQSGGNKSFQTIISKTKSLGSCNVLTDIISVLKEITAGKHDNEQDQEDGNDSSKDEKQNVNNSDSSENNSETKDTDNKKNTDDSTGNTNTTGNEEKNPNDNSSGNKTKESFKKEFNIDIDGSDPMGQMEEILNKIVNQANENANNIKAYSVSTESYNPVMEIIKEEGYTNISEGIGRFKKASDDEVEAGKRKLNANIDSLYQKYIKLAREYLDQYQNVSNSNNKRRTYKVKFLNLPYDFRQKLGNANYKETKHLTRNGLSMFAGSFKDDKEMKKNMKELDRQDRYGKQADVVYQRFLNNFKLNSSVVANDKLNFDLAIEELANILSTNQNNIKSILNKQMETVTEEAKTFTAGSIINKIIGSPVDENSIEIGLKKYISEAKNITQLSNQYAKDRNEIEKYFTAITKKAKGNTAFAQNLSSLNTGDWKTTVDQLDKGDSINFSGRHQIANQAYYRYWYNYIRTTAGKVIAKAGNGIVSGAKAAGNEITTGVKYAKEEIKNDANDLAAKVKTAGNKTKDFVQAMKNKINNLHTANTQNTSNEQNTANTQNANQKNSEASENNNIKVTLKNQGLSDEELNKRVNYKGTDPKKLRAKERAQKILNQRSEEESAKKKASEESKANKNEANTQSASASAAVETTSACDPLPRELRKAMRRKIGKTTL